MSYFCPRCATQHDTAACPQQSGSLHQCAVCGQQVGWNGHACGGTPPLVPQPGIPAPGSFFADVVRLEAEVNHLNLQVDELQKQLFAAKDRAAAAENVAALAGRKYDDEERLTRALYDLLMRRRVVEPKHSREDHECDECTVLANMEGFLPKQTEKLEDPSQYRCSKGGCDTQSICADCFGCGAHCGCKCKATRTGLHRLGDVIHDGYRHCLECCENIKI